MSSTDAEQVRRRNAGVTNGSASSSSTMSSKPPQSPPSLKRISQSAPNYEQILTENLSPDCPIHVAQDSLFSSSSGYTNYRGFFNLAIILLVLSNTRVALENLIKYGILIDFGYWFQYISEDAHKSPVGILLLLINANIFAALMIEKKLCSGQIQSNRRGVLFHGANLATVLILPVLIILLKGPNPLGATFCLTLYTVSFLKLISYAHVNYWCRSSRDKRTKSGRHTLPEEKKWNTPPSTRDNVRYSYSSRPRSYSYSSDANLIAYPDNLTLSNIYYFMAAPTLCYELNFPRLPKVRKWFVMKRLIECFFLMQLVVALCQQWIVPLLKNSLQPFIGMNYSRMLERLLKLAIPNHIIWLISFYWIFHSLMNLIAELLRFADREFYRDWWNAETIDYFWRNWNIPVHRWCVRHVYKPMIGSGYGRMTSSLAVFFVSAFFHEYLISVPLHLFRLWAFIGMFAQVPLNMVTSRWAKGRLGNIVVWLSLIVGQPLCILMYVHDWYVTHYMPYTGRV